MMLNFNNCQSIVSKQTLHWLKRKDTTVEASDYKDSHLEFSGDIESRTKSEHTGVVNTTQFTDASVVSKYIYI